MLAILIAFSLLFGILAGIVASPAVATAFAWTSLGLILGVILLGIPYVWTHRALMWDDFKKVLTLKSIKQEDKAEKKYVKKVTKTAKRKNNLQENSVDARIQKAG